MIGIHVRDRQLRDFAAVPPVWGTQVGDLPPVAFLWVDESGKTSSSADAHLLVVLDLDGDEGFDEKLLLSIARDCWDACWRTNGRRA